MMSLNAEIPWQKSDQKKYFGLKNKSLWERINLLELSPLNFRKFDGVRLDFCLNHFNPHQDIWIREISRRTITGSILQISFCEADKLNTVLGNKGIYQDYWGGFYRRLNTHQVRVFMPKRHLKPVTEYLVSLEGLKSQLQKFNWKLVQLIANEEPKTPKDCYIYSQWVKLID